MVRLKRSRHSKPRRSLFRTTYTFKLSLLNEESITVEFARLRFARMRTEVIQLQAAPRLAGRHLQQVVSNSGRRAWL